MFKSEKLILDFLATWGKERRHNFTGSDKYLDFIFLCGKQLKEGDNRCFIRDQLKKRKKFSLFSEHLYQQFTSLDYDLLTIEEILFSICSSVILIVESYGSACEIGAFSFVKQNIAKLWVINDEQYRNISSFIQDGPIKKIEQEAQGHVIYQKFNNKTIVFDEKAVLLFNSVGRKRGFGKKLIDYENQNVTAIIYDLGFIVYVLFDYIRLFGLLCEESIFTMLKALFPAKDYEIELPSKTRLKIEDSELVFKKLLGILVDSKILLRKNNKGKIYFTLDYSMLQQTVNSLSEFSSFIFNSTFLNVKRNQSKLNKIWNTELQEGFKLWEH